MSRQLRIDPPGGWHHAMAGGARRQAIFLDDHDRHSFLRNLKRGLERWKIELHGWAMMGNHYHLLVRCPQAGLSAFMHDLNGAHAQRFNHRHAQVGPLFRGRFRSILIEEHEYLVEVLRYIERNPVAAGLVKRAVDFPWSSHRDYLGLRPHIVPLEVDRVLGYFDGDRARLAAFVDAPDSIAARAVLEAVDNELPALGSAAFLANVACEAPGSPETAASRRRMLKTTNSDRVQLWLCDRLNVDTADMHSGEARQLAVYVLHRLGVASMSELATAFGYRGKSSVSSAIRRIDKRLPFDPHLRKIVQDALVLPLAA